MSPDSPYVGLVPYLEKDAERFCGRSHETEALVSLMLSSRCVVVHGPSGVGKSSLLRAGVSHNLQQIAVAQRKAFGKPDFVVAYCSDWKDSNPFLTVSAAIAQAWQNAANRDSNLRDVVAAGVRTQKTDLVLILDQFEEFFLYHPDAVARPGDAAHGWLGQIAGLMSSASGENSRGTLLPVHLVITLREEALAKLDSLQRLLPGLFDNVYRVAPLTSAQAKSAVIEPLHWWNATHADEPPVSASEAFADQVVGEVRQGHVSFAEISRARQSTTPAADSVDAIEAPFLQLVLERVWSESREQWLANPQLPRQLDTAMLTGLGGAAAIVNNHLKKSLEESKADHGGKLFSTAELELVAQLSLHLVTIDLAKIAHSSASLAEFVERPAEEVERVLLKLERLRILRRIPHPTNPGQDRYEIFHDMLGKAIVNWRPTYLSKVAAARQKEKSWNMAKGFILAAVCIFAAFLATSLWRVSSLKNTAERSARMAVLAAGKEKEANALTGKALKEAEKQREEAERQRQKAEAQRDAAESTRLQLEQQLSELQDINEKDRIRRATELAELEKQLTRTVDFSNNAASIQEIQKAVFKFKDQVNQVNQNADPAYQNKLQQIDDTVQTLRTPLVARLEGHTDSINSVAFAITDFLATASADGTTIAWGTDGKRQRTFTGSSKLDGVLTLAFAKDPKYLVTGSAAGSLRLLDWHTADTKVIENAKLHRDGISKIAFSPDYYLFASSSADRNVSLIFSRDKWLGPNVATDRLVLKQWAHGGIVSNVSFSPDGSAVVTSCDDHTVRIFSTRDDFGLLASTDGKAPTRHFVFSPVNPGIVAGAAGTRCILWNWQARPKQPAFLEGHIAGITGIAFSNDGKYLASIACDGECILWDVAAAKSIGRIPTAIGGRLYGVAWDKSNLALIGEDGLMEVWNTTDIQSPVRLGATQAHQGSGRGIRFSPDGNLIATWSGRIRDNAMDAKGKAAKFSPNVLKSPDNTAALWDVRTILLNASRPKR